MISNTFYSSPSGEVVKTKAKGLCTDKGGEGKEKSINLFKKGGKNERDI